MILADFACSIILWILFFIVRKVVLGQHLISINSILHDKNFLGGALFIAVFYVIIAALVGEYMDLYKKSRIKALRNTFLQTLLGTVFLFFILLLDDTIYSYTDYYILFFILWMIFFLGFSAIRIAIITYGKKQLYNGEIYFKTLVLGVGKKASFIVQQLLQNKQQPGYKIIGFIAEGNKGEPLLTENIIGNIEDLALYTESLDFEECIIAFDHPKNNLILNTIQILDKANKNIKIIPDNYQIIAGSVKLDNIYSALLLEINNVIIKPWQSVAKRFLDILLSFMALIFGLPILILCIVKIKLEAHGSIFYHQERVGKDGRVFNLYKFRSMFNNAEEDTPLLAHDFDNRITPWGKTMRKYRFDELPQIWNVIKGDMSWVGPRPERQFFINQITAKAPQYTFLHKIKPGITSWGMVKYGYASNIDAMIERMQFDILYIENYSLTLDISILLQTFITIIKGKGK